MLEIIYRIYEVADEKTAQENMRKDSDFGLYSSTSKARNIELLMDCLVCDSREQFKEIIKSQYGNIAFRNSKKLKAGDLYCIIIGEHCYNTQRYFNKVTFTCDCCGAKVETYYGKPIGIKDFAKKRFCSQRCAEIYKDNERKRIASDEDTEFFVTRDMFTEDIAGYIYKITKKSTGEFYIGQTMYVPVFRWGQHLKTGRFPISNITDYKFEVIEIVPKSENILEREKYYIQKFYKDNPKLSLNIACTANIEPDLCIPEKIKSELLESEAEE